MRTPVRDLTPGDQIRICGQTHTVTSATDHGTAIHVYVTGDHHCPYVFARNGHVTLTQPATTA